MKIKTLKDFDFTQKKVILRTDFNVPLGEKGEILSFYRVKAVLETIRYLVEQKAKVIIISHLGRPQEIKDKRERISKFSLKGIANYLKDVLGEGVSFSLDCIGREAERRVNSMKEGEVLVLENLRFHPEEQENNEDFALSLSKLGDIYINEAFSVSHRKHASIVSLPKYLPHGIGFLFSQEIENLSKAKKGKKPILLIIGGTKTSTKIRSIKRLMKNIDYLLVGGKIGEVILESKSILVGRPLPPEDILEICRKLDITDSKIHLPIDVVVSPDRADSYSRTTSLGNVRKEEEIFDLGKETINFFSRFINESRTIILAGPLGFFEDDKFALGTKKIVETIGKNKEAFTVAGGGETILFLEENNFLDKFDFVSTGGGAMLDFLSGEKLPGIEVLEQPVK